MLVSGNNILNILGDSDELLIAIQYTVLYTKALEHTVYGYLIDQVSLGKCVYTVRFLLFRKFTEKLFFV